MCPTRALCHLWLIRPYTPDGTHMSQVDMYVPTVVNDEKYCKGRTPLLGHMCFISPRTYMSQQG